MRLMARIFFFQLNTCGHSPHVTSSLTRGLVCCLQLLLALASTSILRSESHRTQDHILLSQILVSPKLFVSTSNRVAQLYPQALGSLSVGFYDSQGYGGGDLNLPPHPEGPVCYALTHIFEADQIQNIAPNSASTF
jgi:hypothetical protein